MALLIHKMSINHTDKQKIAAVFSGVRSEKKVCPVKDIMANYGDKWSIYSVLLLGEYERMRFSELRAGINGISQRMLTVTLRALEQDGIISRTSHPETHAKVEYSLTELGESLVKQLLQFAAWADVNFEKIIQARKNYTRRTE